MLKILFRANFTMSLRCQWSEDNQVDPTYSPFYDHDHAKTSPSRACGIRASKKITREHAQKSRVYSLCFELKITLKSRTINWSND